MQKLQQIFPSFLFGLVLLAITGLMTNAWADETLYLDPSDHDTKWMIYVYGVGDIVASVLEATKNILGSSSFTYFVVIVLLIGLIFMGLKFTVDFKPQTLVIFFLSIIGFSYFTTTAKVDVVVSDSYNHTGGMKNYPIEDVPAIVGLPIALISTGIHNLQLLFSEKFSIPGVTGSSISYSEYSVANKGFNYLGSIIKDSQSLRITNPNVKASFDEYFAQCVLYAQYSGDLVDIDLITSSDILSDVKVTTEARYTRYYDPITGAVSMETCKDAYDKIKTWLNKDSTAESFIKQIFSKYTLSAMGSVPTSSLASAYAVLGASGTGSNIAVQNALINSIDGAYEHAAAKTGTESLALAINTEQAKSSQLTGWYTAASVFSDIVIYLLGGLQALVFAMLPLIVSFAAIPGMGLAMLGSAFRIILWLSLWPLGLEIVNFLSFIVSSNDLSGYVTGAAGPSMATAIGMRESTTKLSMVFSLISTLVPTLLYSLVNKGEINLSEAISKGTGADVGKAAGSAAAKGDVAYDTWNSNSVSAGKYDTAFQLAGGNNGAEVADNPTAHMSSNANVNPVRMTVNGEAPGILKKGSSTENSNLSSVQKSFSSIESKVGASISSKAAAMMSSLNDSMSNSVNLSDSESVSSAYSKLSSATKNFMRNSTTGVTGTMSKSELKQFTRAIGIGADVRRKQWDNAGLVNKKGDIAGSAQDIDRALGNNMISKSDASFLKSHLGQSASAVARLAAQEAFIGSAAEKIAHDNNLNAEEKERAFVDAVSNISHAGNDDLTKGVMVGKDFNGKGVKDAQGKDVQDGALYKKGNDGKWHQLSNPKGEATKEGERWFNTLKNRANELKDYISSDSFKEKALLAGEVASTVLLFTPAAPLGGMLRGLTGGARIAFMASKSGRMVMGAGKIGKSLSHASHNPKNLHGRNQLQSKMQQRKEGSKKGKAAHKRIKDKESSGATVNTPLIQKIMNGASFMPSLSGKAGLSVGDIESTQVSESNGTSQQGSEGGSDVDSKTDTSTELKNKARSYQRAAAWMKAHSREDKKMESMTKSLTKASSVLTSYANNLAQKNTLGNDISINDYSRGAQEKALNLFENFNQIKKDMSHIDPATVPDPGSVLNDQERQHLEHLSFAKGFMKKVEDIINSGKGNLGLSTDKKGNLDFKIDALNDTFNSFMLGNGVKKDTQQSLINEGKKSATIIESMNNGSLFDSPIIPDNNSVIGGMFKMLGAEGVNLSNEKDKVIQSFNNMQVHGLNESGEMVSGTYSYKDNNGNSVYSVGVGDDAYYATYDKNTGRYSMLENQSRAIQNEYNSLVRSGDINENGEGITVKGKSFMADAKASNLATGLFTAYNNGDEFHVAMSGGLSTDNYVVSRDGIPLTNSLGQPHDVWQGKDGKTYTLDSNGYSSEILTTNHSSLIMAKQEGGGGPVAFSPIGSIGGVGYYKGKDDHFYTMGGAGDMIRVGFEEENNANRLFGGASRGLF